MSKINGNEAMLRKAQDLMERGEFPEEVSMPMLWAGMLAQNGMLGILEKRLKSVESIYQLLKIVSPVLMLLLGALVVAMIDHLTGG